MDNIIRQLFHENEKLKNKINELEKLIHILNHQTTCKIDKLNNILKNDFYVDVFKERDE